MHNLNRQTQNPHITSLTLEVRTTMLREDKWKPVVLPLPMKIVDQKQSCILRELQITATINHLEYAGAVVPITSLSTHILTMAKDKWI